MNRGGQGGGAGIATPKAVAAAGGKEPKGVSFSASKPGSVPVLEGADKSGIETLEDSPEEEDGPGNIKRNKPAADQEAVDVGLGSTGSSTIAVEDRRTRKKKSSERDAPSQPEDLVHHHWGYSEPGAAIGLERDVRMDVEARRFVIARKHAVKVEDTDSPEDTFAKIVTVLDLQARDWGKPAQGFYWKPSLRYVIADGGQENYERVKSLLERAGISSTIEQGHDHGAVAEKPKPSSSTHSPAPATNPPKTSRRFFRGILK